MKKHFILIFSPIVFILLSVKAVYGIDPAEGVYCIDSSILGKFIRATTKCQTHENWSKSVVHTQGCPVLELESNLKTFDSYFLELLAKSADSFNWKLGVKTHFHSPSPAAVPLETSSKTEKTALLPREFLTIPGVVDWQGEQAITGTGSTMEEIIQALAKKGRTLPSVPGIGAVTLGGVLANGGHGFATKSPSPAAFVSSLEALIFDPHTNRYILKWFTKDDPEFRSLLINTGRILITRVTLDTVEDTQVIRRHAFYNVDKFMSDGLLSSQTEANDYFYSTWFIHGREDANLWVMTSKREEDSDEYPEAGNDNYNLPIVSGVLGSYALGYADQATNWQPAYRYWLNYLVWWHIHGALEHFQPQKGKLSQLQQWVDSSTNIPIVFSAFLIHTNTSELDETARLCLEDLKKRFERYEKKGLYPVDLGVDFLVHSAEDSHLYLNHHGKINVNSSDRILVISLNSFSSNQNWAQFIRELENDWVADNSLSRDIKPYWGSAYGYSAEGMVGENGLMLKTISERYPDFQKARSDYERLDPQRIFENSFEQRLFSSEKDSAADQQ